MIQIKNKKSVITDHYFNRKEQGGTFMRLYRKRLIPEEIVELKEDQLVYADEQKLVTTWTALHPRKDFDHGCSVYFLKEGFKVSKFFRSDGSLKCLYCDIIRQEQIEDGYIFVDLLADVIIENDCVRVVDLDELALAYEKDLLAKDEMLGALRQLNGLLHKIYSGEFSEYEKQLPD